MQSTMSEDPRVSLAAERTLLAWIRTGLALMGFGFVVARFGLFLREVAAVAERKPPALPAGLSVWIGTALVLFGVAVTLLATVQHVRLLGRLERGEPYRPSGWSLGVIVSLILAAAGIGITGYLIASTFQLESVMVHSKR